MSDGEIIEGADEPVEGSAATVDAPTAFALSQIIEAILFASQKPVAAKELRSILKGAAEANPEDPQVTQYAKVKEPDLIAAIEVLEKATSDSSHAYEVRESVSGWQLVTKPTYAPWLRQLFPENRPARISAPAMETLAIIAYRQPITRADIEAVRGVAVDGVMQTLLDRGLLKIAGRAEIPGRPLLYETTQNFMEHFGLKHLDDLPNAAELRKIVLPTAPIPEAAAAVEEATVPVEESAAVEQNNDVPEEAPTEEATTLPETSEPTDDSLEEPKAEEALPDATDVEKES